MRTARPTMPSPAAANVQPRQMWPELNGRGFRYAGRYQPVPCAAAPPGSRSVILTGAARGVGAALFTALTARGDRLLALGREFTDKQRRIAADRAWVVLRDTDLSDPAALPSATEVRYFLDGADETDPGEAVLVHAATGAEFGAASGELDHPAMAAAVQANLLAPMRLTNRFLFGAPARLQRLRVVYLTDGAAHRPDAGRAMRCATAVAAEMFMRCVQSAANPRWTVDIVDPEEVIPLLPDASPVPADPHAVAAGLVTRLFADGV